MSIDRRVLAASWRAYWSQDMSRHGPYWLQIMWTVVLAAGIAALFTVVGFIGHPRLRANWLNPADWADWFGRNFIVTLTITSAIHVLFEAGGALLGRKRIRAFSSWQRTFYFSAIPVVGLYGSWPLGYWLAGGNVSAMWSSGSAIVASILLTMALVFATSVYWNARHRQNVAEAHATEAQLKLLQAQIEPHFLFNTLANVVSLIDTDAPRAKQMLESFIDYLRASLTHLRRADSSLGAELDMAQAYLALLGMRMDDRLRYDIEASEAARTAVLPPLLLQPLVENAIHHGLEPKVDGGRVSIRAEVVDAQLRISVRDDGLGLAAGTPPATPRNGSGVGLQNVRDRLESRYGNLASLRLTDLSPGVLATLELPFETTTTPCPCPRP